MVHAQRAIKEVDLMVISATLGQDVVGADARELLMLRIKHLKVVRINTDDLDRRKLIPRRWP